MDKTYFNDYYIDAYEAARTVNLKYVKNGMNILDIGAGKAPIAKYLIKNKKNLNILCIDKKYFTYEEKELTSIQSDINEYWENNNKNKFDYIILNAALHEIWTETKLTYLPKMFSKIKNLLRKSGIIFIGDYYYDKSVGISDYEKYREQLINEISHADPREKFYLSGDILKFILADEQFKLLLFEEIPVARDIKRFFYSLIIILK